MQLGEFSPTTDSLEVRHEGVFIVHIIVLSNSIISLLKWCLKWSTVFYSSSGQCKARLFKFHRVSIFLYLFISWFLSVPLDTSLDSGLQVNGNFQGIWQKYTSPHEQVCLQTSWVHGIFTVRLLKQILVAENILVSHDMSLATTSQGYHQFFSPPMHTSVHRIVCVSGLDQKLYR